MVDPLVGYNILRRLDLPELHQRIQILSNGDSIGKFGVVQDAPRHHGVGQIQHVVRGPHADVVDGVPRRGQNFKLRPADLHRPLPRQ